MKNTKLVLDACCGSKMMWFEKENPLAVYMDKRTCNETLCDGRTLEVSPDVVADFTNMPFEDGAFALVVFDPPHLKNLGNNSWLAKKYGKLIGDWEIEIAEGFKECFRVLKQSGTLIFKWNETDISIERVLTLAPYKPLFGNRTGKRNKTIWCVFLKP